MSDFFLTCGICVDMAVQLNFFSCSSAMQQVHRYHRFCASHGLRFGLFIWRCVFIAQTNSNTPNTWHLYCSQITISENENEKSTTIYSYWAQTIEMHVYRQNFTSWFRLIEYLTLIFLLCVKKLEFYSFEHLNGGYFHRMIEKIVSLMLLLRSVQFFFCWSTGNSFGSHVRIIFFSISAIDFFPTIVFHIVLIHILSNLKKSHNARWLKRPMTEKRHI